MQTWFVSLFLLVCFPALAGAHALAPALLEIQEIGDGKLTISFKTSRTRAPGVKLFPLLPPGCRKLGPERTSGDDQSITQQWLEDCGSAGIVGQTVGVEGLSRARIDALLRVELADGRVVRTVLRPDASSWVVPARESSLSVAYAYAKLGFSHILSGADHLLFVFGLLLLVGGATSVLWLGGWRLLLKTVTAFTVGHSVTLSLAALGLAVLPSGPIEVGIALSVLWLAIDLSREGARPSLTRRFPWLLAGAFGLLHGMGFAGALHEVGLPAGDVPLALFSFNVGIEIGQLVFLGVVLVAWAILARAIAGLPGWTRWIPVYTLGTLATYWCLERSAALLR